MPLMPMYHEVIILFNLCKVPNMGPLLIYGLVTTKCENIFHRKVLLKCIIAITV